MKKLVLIPLILVLGVSSMSSNTPADLEADNYTINVNDIELHKVLDLLARRSGLELEVSGPVETKVSISLKEITIEKALDRLANLYGFSYQMVDGRLEVQAHPQRNPAQAAPGSSGNVHRILVRNTAINDIAAKIPSLLQEGESLQIDELNNAFILYGSRQTQRRLAEVVTAFDYEPRQILIEAQIVEATKNFTQDFGFRYGDMSAPSTPLTQVGNSTGIIDTGLPSDPNLLTRHVIGMGSGFNLETVLAAAESNGEAKVISRPKIVTLNNKPARINSGVQFYVKTLSTLTTGTGDEETAVSSGLETIRAGFELNVNPTIIGEDRIRLTITVSNSEPNDGLAVDGIPGVIDNSANTSIIVQDGQTATIAGLLKSTKSDFNSGVPFISKIPVLGWLFKSHSLRDRSSELMIFVTPNLLNKSKDVSLSAPPKDISR